MIDDAQRKYGDTGFWTRLFKLSVKLPLNVRFIISATYLLSGEASNSPVEFESIPSRLERKTFCSAMLKLCSFWSCQINCPAV